MREADPCNEPLHVVAFSGGKDSTALAVMMAERGLPIDRLLCTPTGDELPEMADHCERIAQLLGLPLTVPPGPTLKEACASNKALPNPRMRFCTRLVKIHPALAWIKAQDRAVRMYIGLRADEEDRVGIISNAVEEVYPLREWGVDLEGVLAFLRERDVPIPRRTDCARCPYQRLGEWYRLWREHPEIYADAEAQEAEYGHTFRSPSRDTWPAALSELRGEFQRGRVPRGARVQLTIFDEAPNGDGPPSRCRICTL